MPIQVPEKLPFEEGFYECVSDKHQKFWAIVQNNDTGRFTTSWGKLGRPAQGEKSGLLQREATAKVNEKIRKGYKFKMGVGAMAKHCVYAASKVEMREAIASRGLITPELRKKHTGMDILAELANI